MTMIIREDKQAPIVSNILAKGYTPTIHEASANIIHSEDRHRADALNAIVSGGVSLLSGAICLSLSPMLLPMPILATAVCGVTWYNSRVRRQRREQEMEFIKRHREVFAIIDLAQSKGATPDELEAGYKSVFIAYLDDELGRTPQLEPYFEDKPLRLRDIPIDDSPIPETPANTEPLRSEELNGDKPKSETIATTGIQAIGQDQDATTEPAKAGLPGFIAEMTYPVRSGMIVGLPGAGKDLVMANVLNRIADRSPEMQIFITDPKNSPKESGYFQRFDSANVDRFKVKGMQAFEIQEQMDAMYSRIEDAGEKTLWVINEFATLSGLVSEKWMKGFAARLQSIVQQGDSEENYLWIVSQTGNLSELKLPSSLRGTLARNFLAIAQPGYEAALAGLTRTDLITNHDDARMRAMWDRSPVKRAYYYSTINRWEAMPELPNLSGYDRDKRQWIGDALPSEPVIKSTDFPVAAVERMVATTYEKPGTIDANGTKEPIKKAPKPAPVYGLTSDDDSGFVSTDIKPSTDSVNHPGTEVANVTGHITTDRILKAIRNNPEGIKIRELRSKVKRRNFSPTMENVRDCISDLEQDGFISIDANDVVKPL